MKDVLDAKNIFNLVRAFQPACVLIAGAELDLFTRLHNRPMSAVQLARRIEGDLRATTILLDALTALGALVKTAGPAPVYRVPPTVAEALTESGSRSMLHMVRHQGNCLRKWEQLAAVVRNGKSARSVASIRGPAEDLRSFILAMDEVSTPMAPPLIKSLGPLKFKHLLDLGGASGTWTLSFLRFNPGTRATLFDLPEVIPLARRRMRAAGLAGRVRLVPGSFYTDALPTGADLAWVSAIVHQNSRAQNRTLFRKVSAALVRGGRILIRDIVMDRSRTQPAGGALFAVNMLVATSRGGTFTFDELRADLQAAGFVKVQFLRRGEWMDSVVCATKP